MLTTPPPLPQNGQAFIQLLQQTLLDNLFPPEPNPYENDLYTLLRSSTTTCLAIGDNPESRALAALGMLDGRIDDREQSGQLWQGLPIIPMHQVPADTLIVNCSTSVSPIQATKALHQAGLHRILPLSALLMHPQCPISKPWFVTQQRLLLDTHSDELAELYEQLHDDVSRQTLVDTLRFRLTADAVYMQNYAVRPTVQYLEPFMQYTREVFVDAGAFDGDTTEAFCHYAPDYRAGHLFEPDSKNMLAARLRLKGMDRLHFHDVGLSDQTGTLQFRANQGSACSITPPALNLTSPQTPQFETTLTHNTQLETISVDTLDHYLDEAVTFIKMDLEGWEPQALRGCAQQIQQNNPKLAISVYHHAEHFIQVPQLIQSYNANYRMYLRHYTQGWSETIMYFVPRSLQEKS